MRHTGLAPAAPRGTIKMELDLEWITRYCDKLTLVKEECERLGRSSDIVVWDVVVDDVAMLSGEFIQRLRDRRIAG